MKRVVLFLLTNLAVLVVLSIVTNLLGLNRALAENGLNLGALLVFSAIIGFGGAFISLLISKTIAKWSTGAQVISEPRSEGETWLLATVKKLADRAGVAMPEVAIYEGEPNAFATGAFKNSALVAVSTGLLNAMSREEIEAVLGHEMAHVTVLVCEIVFGVLASIIVAWFSRRREFRADAGSARYLGTPQPMMHALARLGGLPPGELPKSLAGFGITDKAGFMGLFATHPPIEERIRALQTQG